MCLFAAILAATLITNATDLASAMNRAVEGARFELTGTVATSDRHVRAKDDERTSIPGRRWQW